MFIKIILIVVLLSSNGTCMYARTRQFQKLNTTVSSITPVYRYDSHHLLECLLQCHSSDRCIVAQYHMDNHTCVVMESFTSGEIAENSNVTTYLKIKPACDTGWTFYAGNCYISYDSRNRTWPYAAKSCNEFGANLTSVASQAEHDVIVSIRRSPRLSYWLGGRSMDTGVDSTWLWSDGEPWVFEKWASDQPNFLNADKCLTIDPGYSDLWNDKACKNQWYPAICKKHLIV